MHNTSYQRIQLLHQDQKFTGFFTIQSTNNQKYYKFSYRYDPITHLLHLTNAENTAAVQNIREFNCFIHHIEPTSCHQIMFTHEYNTHIPDTLVLNFSHDDDIVTPSLDRIQHHCAQGIRLANFTCPNVIDSFTSFHDMFSSYIDIIPQHYQWINQEPNADIYPQSITQNIQHIPIQDVTISIEKDLVDMHTSIWIYIGPNQLYRQSSHIPPNSDPSTIVTQWINDAIAQYPQNIMQTENNLSQHEHMQRYRALQHHLPHQIPQIIAQIHRINTLIARHYTA